MRWASVRRRLNRKEVPLLVTLLAASCGWAINQIVDRALDSPTIEYKTAIESQGNKKIVRVTVANLSKQAFFGLRFELQAPEIQPCDTLPEYKPPAWPSKKTPDPGTGGITFLVEQLHPDWEMTMCAKMNKNEVHKFLLRETGVGKQGDISKQAVRLVVPSLETFLVKWNLFLMGLLAATSLITFLYWLGWSEDIE